MYLFKTLSQRIPEILSTFIFVFFMFPGIAVAHSEIIVVKMTPNGFEPNEITIDENTSLNFVNKDTVARWPASDLHPTHDVFPEFDPKKPIPPGEIWIFKPGKVGDWKFHDHERPHFKGVLHVIAENTATEMTLRTASTDQPQATSSAVKTSSGIAAALKSLVEKTMFYFFSGIARVFGVSLTETPATTLSATAITGAEFKKLPADEQLTYLETYAQSEGSEATWKFVRETYKGESGTQGSVHDLAHLSGQLFFQEKGFTGLSSCTVEFAFGCFHGFLDMAFKSDLSGLAQAETACRALGSGVSGPVASCIHGIGHGVASYFQTSKLNEVLQTCDKLSEAARHYCYDGVFMEFERNSNESFYKKDDPLYPCNTLEQKYAFACGRNQPQVLLQRFKKNFTEVAAICIGSQQTEFKTACVDALGFISAGQGKGEPTQIVGLCQSLKESAYVDQCLKAAAGEIIFQEMPQWFDKAPHVCGASTQTAQAVCFDYINRLMSEYGRLRPQSKGEDSNTYVRAQMRICLDQGGRDDCYEKVSRFFSDQFGLKQSLQLLQTNEDNPAVYARCHEVTHYLSRFAYEQNKSVPQTYALCDSTCHGGCYHGTLEAYLKEQQLSLGDDRIKEAFTTVCGSEKDYDNLLVYYECMHGLGHAGMFITEMEVPASLALCDALASIEHRERCYSGVFMENSSSSTSTDHPGKYVKAEDPMYPCNSLEEKYLKICYRYQSSHFALISKHQWRQVAQLCLQVPEPYRHDCFRTIGTNQVGFTQDTQLMKTNCELMPNEFKDTCFAGVIGSMSYRFVGEIGKMTAFCTSLAGGHQAFCFQNIGSSVADWSASSVAQADYCSQIPSASQQDWCKQGLASAHGRIGVNQVFN